VSREKPVRRPPHGPASDESKATIGSYPSPAEAIGRLEQLRKVVPVFADELMIARREAAQLRTENAWLLEQLRARHGQPAERSFEDTQAVLHQRSHRLTESQGHVGAQNALVGHSKRSNSKR
jgi:hypothetical protein